ncbi:MAG: Sua5/YciO/YrdC/YwlC family protein [Planctomycetales bacterium]|nr:Sua5/YciO/YrdC/YwlC family protein [Planctomycetales bacterium]
MKCFDWKGSDDPRDIVHIVVQNLVEGQLAVLPAETAYHVVASALKPTAVEHLHALSTGNRRPYLLLRSSEESLDYSPKLSRIAERVIRRGWPGPLILELESFQPESLACQLPPTVQDRIRVDGRFLPQRVAAHEAIVHAMRLLPGPLVALPLLDTFGNPVCTPEVANEVAQTAAVALIDDGPTHYGDLATAIRIENQNCSMQSPGVVDLENLQRLSQFIVLLVCTGNTCRSPMAEVLMRHALERRFGTANFSVVSAGLSAFPGGAASPEAIAVMAQRNLNLRSHQSKSITERVVKFADLILTMTNSHRRAIVERMPDTVSRLHLVSGTGQDVSDPFGGNESIYADCADQIEQYINGWVNQIDETWIAHWDS